MELKYLGTAAAEGIPGIFCQCALCREAARRGGHDLRSRSQAVIDGRLLIDLPPDAYWHMVRDGVDLPGMAHLLITHTHADHFYPEELSYRRPGFCGARGTLTLYGNGALLQKVTAFLQANGASAEDCRLSLVRLSAFTPLGIAGYTVTPLPAAHDRHEECFIYLIEQGGRRLLYGNDTGVFPESVWAYLKGRPLHLVSLDCTYGRQAEGSNHMGAPDLVAVRQRLIDMGCADGGTLFAATHFSHNGGALHAELEALLAPHGFVIAHDGLALNC